MPYINDAVNRESSIQISFLLQLTRVLYVFLGVYVFGFIFMLPQLFVNYKVRKVVHNDKFYFQDSLLKEPRGNCL
jgi:hypothetical protein